MEIRIILYLMMATQMVAWAWMQSKGGKLSDHRYIAFCAMMMVGQTGASLECIFNQAWGTLVVQIYFFLFTAYGGYKRYQQMRPTS
ncbi:MAG: hypothetical protein PHO91_02240 [Patescibacteria group bacterium]|nr:hypothetical protein [Patescibacteria group bacterium]